MSILQIGSYLYPDTPGGAEISAQNVALALESAGHSIVRMRWSPVEELTAMGRIRQTREREWVAETWRPYTPLETKGGLNKAAFYALEMFTTFRVSELEGIVANEGVEAVVIHSFRGMGYRLLAAIARLNLPTVLFLHDYALICMNKGMFRRNANCIVTCRECQLLAKFNARTLSKIRSLCFIGPSNQIVQKVRGHLAIDHAHYESIPNPNSYVTDPHVRIAHDQPVLGYVGRLEPDKGLPDLLKIADALHERHNVRLVIAGAGSLDSAVVQFAEARPWVEYKGYVNPDSMVKLYHGIDIIALPSIWAENFSGVLVQALANGIPAVAFDVGGNAEIITHNKTGLVVPAGNFRAMYDAISSIILNPALFTAMSEASIRASGAFSADRLRQRVIKTISRMIVEGKMRSSDLS